ncbi:DUF2059 domain-containing protein [Mesorhizobium sp. CAU 1741]|uniref:DUF2059 domain-containing protein n=1 Tax=Mesorhizobium sp. CAU 1741 TaxID=3140366 RepID=UPI00325AA75B
MNLVNRSRSLALAAAATLLVAAASPSMAQDISDTHLAAARTAVSAMGATTDFDNILPRVAQALKTELIQKNPDMQGMIVEVVDSTAISLAARRGDLEREAAIAHARVFTEPQLTQIAEFYNSETGKKLLADGPIVAREVIQAAEIWQRGIARDLAQQVAQELTARTDGAADTEGTAPEN